jgi:hypothetical protein
MIHHTRKTKENCNFVQTALTVFTNSGDKVNNRENNWANAPEMLPSEYNS